MRRVFLVMLVSWFLTPVLAVAGVRVEGRVVDQSGLALPGVTVRIAAVPVGDVQTAVTGGNGEYTFEVEPGQYRLDASLDGFQPASREVRVDAAATLQDLVLSLGHFAQETTVVAELPTEIQPRQFGAPATISEKVIDNAPLRTNRYDDLLPLLPNVVRGPDGLVSVAGARAPQGVVLLNGVPGMDVASGEPVAPVPLAAVESVQVITTGFPAEYSRSTGGVTVVNTRAGSDKVKFTVNSFTPRPRIDDGGVRGIEAWEPNMGIRGPIARGRAWFSQSVDYRYERTKFDTLAGEQDRRLHGITSFSQVDGRVGASHVVSGWISGQAQRIDGAGLSAFTPLGTVPNSRPGTWGSALVDRATLGGSATLETRLEARRQTLSLDPVGNLPYVVGHDITRGSYFETLDRHAMVLQASSVFSRTWGTGQGRSHLLKAGISVLHDALDGTMTAAPATYLRSDGTLANVVAFEGPGGFSADAVDAGLFLQDTWTMSDRLVADIGVRSDYGSRVGGGPAPRLGITWKADDETTVTGGLGLFADKTPLAALAYPGYQSRVISRYDTSGALLGTTTYRSVLADKLERAEAWIWNGQVDRRLGGGWQLRVGYQERHGTGELVVTPTVLAGGDTQALLSSSGESRSRSLETTIGFRPASLRHQLYLSYVRSSSRGNTNDFSQVEATYRDPFLQPAAEAPLPVDVPHRLLVWGLFSLPKETTIAPFFEVRSGFPFSAVGEDWTYVGQRNSFRYPTFASLDLIVNKMVTLPGGLRARLGVKLYNVAGRRNGRDIQRDLARPEFGTTYNALGRQVRGIFEIIWNGTRK